MVFRSNHELVLERANWERVVAGDVSAFESIVSTNQSAVSAVAFSIIGDFSISQDISQETFWTAWKNRSQLRESKKLRSWLCGIARNLAKQWCRKNRAARNRRHLSLEFEPAIEPLESDDSVVSDEEQALVWRSLEEVPTMYREVLVLYYRQEHSISDVAIALGIKEDAARQRLSRGRKMLQGHVAKVVEETLGRTVPGRAFTGLVMAGIIGSQNLGKAALASAATGGTATSVSAVAGSSLKAGVAAGGLGGAFGAIAGLSGAFLGMWLPAQLAPTETERQLILSHTKPILGASVAFAIAVLVLALSGRWISIEPMTYAILLLGMMAVFSIVTIRQTLRLQTLIKKIRKELNAKNDPNQSWIAKTNESQIGQKWTGRRYASKSRLFGVPWLHINMSDRESGVIADPSDRLTARGWIAIGDNARGILIGVGVRASGAIAIGGVAVGLVSIGGVAIGGIAVGGISAGLLSVAGFAVGLFAIGGVACGYAAAGGLALGWLSAVGGCAIAYHAAEGGFAWAQHFAVGGAAYAGESNTEAARRVCGDQPLRYLIEVVRNQGALLWGSIIALSILPTILGQFLNRILYEKQEGTNASPDEIK